MSKKDNAKPGVEIDHETDNFKRIKDFEYEDPRWELWAIKVKTFVLKPGIFEINHRRQRQYLFSDSIGKKGHKWQRGIFDSLVTGQPISMIEMNLSPASHKRTVEDGQQRIRTIQAILAGKVAISEHITDYNTDDKDYEDYKGLKFDELDPKDQDRILNTRILVLASKGLSKDELHRRFLVINNNNALTNQDKRSAQTTDGAGYIQKIVAGTPNSKMDDVPNAATASKYKMFHFGEEGGKLKYKYNGLPVPGRVLEEVMAMCFNYIHKKDDFVFAQSALNRLYNVDFKGNWSSFENTVASFEKYLTEYDKSIRNYKKASSVTKKQLFISFLVLKKMMDESLKVNNKTFISRAMESIELLKGQRDDEQRVEFLLKDSDTETIKVWYHQLFQSGNTKNAINMIVDMTYGHMTEKWDFTKLDNKRQFTLEEKNRAWLRQGKKCGYCGVDIPDVKDGFGDHMNPHSLGGKTNDDNLVVCCGECNSKKSNMSYEAWTELLKYYKSREVA